MVCGLCESGEEDMNPSALKPYEKRRTTDVLFLLAIIAMWVVMTIVGAISIPNGNPYRLISHVDDKVGPFSHNHPSLGNSTLTIFLLAMPCVPLFPKMLK